jgi:hypothetical protein
MKVHQQVKLPVEVGDVASKATASNENLKITDQGTDGAIEATSAVVSVLALDDLLAIEKLLAIHAGRRMARRHLEESVEWLPEMRL